MKNYFKNLLVVIAVFSILPIFPVFGTAGDNTLEAGFYKIDITPSKGTVFDPLMAKALVLKQGDEKAAIVVCDIIGIDQKITDEVRKAVSEKTGIPAGHISISATHDHSAGRCEDLATRITQAIIEADKLLKPVSISSGTSMQEGLAFNRRFLMVDGTVRMNPAIDKVTGTSFENGYPYLNPEIIRPVGPVDTDVPIVFFNSAEDNKPIGSLTCFAMHTCVFGSGYSADYPGFLAKRLSESYGENFISIFGEGTCGDINHWDVKKPGEGQNGPGRSSEIGFEIAETIKKAIPNLSSNTPCLKVLHRVVDVPLQSVTEMDIAWAQSARDDKFRDFGSTAFNNRGFLAGVRAGKILRLAEMRKTMESLPLEVQVFRIDKQTAVVTLPGEIFVEHGLTIKKNSAFKNTIILELANNSCSYIPTLKNYSEGSYETVNSVLIPGGGEMLVKAAIELLNELNPVSVK